MPQPRVIYQSVLEALYVRGLHGQVTPALKASLVPLGLDLDAGLPTSLPVDVYTRCLYVTAEALHPHLPPAEGMRLVSSRLGQGYWSTAVGRAMVGLVRLLGPRRTLTWLARLFRATDNYSEVQLEVLGPAHFLLRLNAPDVPPGYGEGLLEEILRVAGAASARVALEDKPAGHTVYRVQWEER